MKWLKCIGAVVAVVGVAAAIDSIYCRYQCRHYIKWMRKLLEEN